MIHKMGCTSSHPETYDPQELHRLEQCVDEARRLGNVIRRVTGTNDQTTGEFFAIHQLEQFQAKYFLHT